MKNSVVFLSFLLFAGFANAQYPLEKGRVEINMGTGLTNQGIPVYLGIDLGVGQNISLGLDCSYRYFNNNTGNTMFKHSFIDLIGNMSYHLNKLLRLRDHTSTDLYLGLCGGYTSTNTPIGYSGEIESATAFGGRFGYRLFFNEKIGLDFELNLMNKFVGGRVGITILL